MWKVGIFIAGKVPKLWLKHEYYGKTTLRVNREKGHLILNMDDKGFRIIKVAKNGEILYTKEKEVVSLYSDFMVDYDWIGGNKIAFVNNLSGLNILEYHFEKYSTDENGFRVLNQDKSKLIL